MWSSVPIFYAQKQTGDNGGVHGVHSVQLGTTSMTDDSTSDQETFRVEYTAYRSPSHAIISTIAVLENTDPMELQPLCEPVRLEAIDELFQRQEPTGRLAVQLVVADYALTLKESGELIVSETAGAR